MTAYRKSGQGGLYTIQYTDGDLEDMDIEEYNFAYALWLKEEGWDIEEGDVADVQAEAVPDKSAQKKNQKKVRSLFQIQKHLIVAYMNALLLKADGTGTAVKRKKLLDIVDLTSTASIAGKHLKDMNNTDKDAVVDKLTKTAKRSENKAVKAAVLAVTYDAACHAAFVKHLEEGQMEVKDMVHRKRKTIIEEQGFLSTIKVGDWVDVEADCSPGLNSDGGIGCVFGLHTEKVGDDGGVRTIALDIHYIVFNRKERGVELKRCVVIPMPYKEDKPTLRTRKKPSGKAVPIATAPPTRTAMEWLKFGLESNRHTKPGWLRDVLRNHNLLHPDDKNVLWQRIMSDYHCQQAYLEGLQGALGKDYKDPRDYIGIRGKESGGRFVSQKKGKQLGVPKNVHTIPYLMWAYDVNKCTFKRRLKQHKMGIPLRPTEPTKHFGTSVIECRVLARERFNPKFFYSHEQAMRYADTRPYLRGTARTRVEVV